MRGHEIKIIACHLDTALCTNVPGLLIGRFWLGVGTSARWISDIYHAQSRSLPMRLFTNTAITGTAVAPTVGSLIYVHLGWQWIHWFQLIINMGGLAVSWFVMQENVLV
ncbi:hypothetical protein BDZ91DRAFT_710856 [Kalaharituber pfeilii]|nr:hypothetical protein BDZ91DRAFT_710856 [Kalaharituber pfeilii]